MIKLKPVYIFAYTCLHIFVLSIHRVFLRADFNVPLKNGAITDDTRIRGAIPTIEYLIRKGAKVILSSHLGRPKGKQMEYTLAPICPHLSALLGQPVSLVPDCIGTEYVHMCT